MYFLLLIHQFLFFFMGVGFMCVYCCCMWLLHRNNKHINVIMIFIYVLRFSIKHCWKKNKRKHIFHRVFRHLFLEHEGFFWVGNFWMLKEYSNVIKGNHIDLTKQFPTYLIKKRICRLVGGWHIMEEAKRD